MKQLALILTFLFLMFHAQAQQQVISLYNGAAPGSESWNWSEGESEQNLWQTKIVFNVAKPTLTVFAPEPGKANGTAVVICPGGAFRALSINSEGFDVARWLVKKGVTCFVLKYRLVHSPSNDPIADMNKIMGTPKFEEENQQLIPLAIADGRAALAYVRTHADEWKLDPNRIGIMGFSAGGTVAASAAYNYTAVNKPNFIAPVYAFFPKQMQGTIIKDAPPAFIAAASDDQLGLAPHSAALYEQWLTAKVPAEIHMYAKGGHGFGMRVQNLPSDKWIERFGEWLQLNGWLEKSKYDPALNAYAKKEFVLSEGKVLPYRILYPENYDRTKKYPVVLMLHGAGERGNDNENQLTHGAKLFLHEENRKNFPAIVIFPQCPQDNFWAAVKIDRNQQPFKIEFDYAAEPNWPLVAANELVKKIAKEEAVDTKRIYISGLSMGGMGTFESVYRYPTLYAAALPICGGGNTTLYDARVKAIPFWVFHGAADAVVDVKLSREMVDRLNALKATVKYSEYPGVNHNSWDNAFAEPDYLKWMFQQKRKK
ncbi:dienelactone hydrolase family protein [Lacibacter luteus]|uniref:dienelactone hydrolase family protein n=1 Tax=Lacibacter luteus TaxID=2508719 RepID=UPI00197C020C|nr:dienelactone hydrolase family protein [Lacibacter luteus]